TTLGRPTTSAVAYGRGYRSSTVASAPGAPSLLLPVVSRTRSPATSPLARCQPAAAQTSVSDEAWRRGAATGAGAATTQTAPRLATASASAARACSHSAGRGCSPPSATP